MCGLAVKKDLIQVGDVYFGFSYFKPHLINAIFTSYLVPLYSQKIFLRHEKIGRNQINLLSESISLSFLNN